MATGNFIVYDTAKKLLANGGIDWDTDTLKASLVTSSYTPSLTHDEWADVSANEVANGNGYTTGGVTVAGTVTNTGSTTSLDTADPSWTASGGSIVARYLVVRKNGSGGGLTNPVIAYCLLDTTPANITVSSGSTLTIQIHSTGMLTLTGATS